MKQNMSLTGDVPNLIYVGSAGINGGILRTRLSNHHDSGGWQTAFRRKVFEYVIGVPEQPRTNATYKEQLKQARSPITEEIKSRFAFRCVATPDYGNFEKWLIQKYRNRLWNKRYPARPIQGNFSDLEVQLMENQLIPFSQLDQHISSVPDEPGVYMLTKV
ncbi:MAG: hypothetical protein WC749_08295 [Dehalococcoidia bacterium]